MQFTKFILFRPQIKRCDITDPGSDKGNYDGVLQFLPCVPIQNNFSIHFIQLLQLIFPLGFSGSPKEL